MASHNNIRRDPVSESYARALFELSLEQGSPEEAGSELSQLVDLLQQHVDLATLFEHPTVDRAQRAATIQKLFKEQVSPVVLKFLLVLNRKGRLGRLRDIAGVYDAMVKEHRGEVDVDVYTATPLSTAQVDKVTARVSVSLGKKAILQPHVDAALIGGLKLRIGDQLLDASVANGLRKLSRQLEIKGHQSVRSHAESLMEA